jgi:hypothetical protein
VPDPDFASPDFAYLEQRLLRQGVSPSYAHRLAHELSDHYDDLCGDALKSGATLEGSSFSAQERLGVLDDIAAAVAARPELMSWVYRYPQLARVALPLAFVALLPAAPVFAGIAHAPSVLRWTCCMMLSAALTAVLLLCMQLSIALG